MSQFFLHNKTQDEIYIEPFRFSLVTFLPILIWVQIGKGFEMYFKVIEAIYSENFQRNRNYTLLIY